jgi:hypothetical protein
MNHDGDTFGTRLPEFSAYRLSREAEAGHSGNSS